MGNVKIVGKIDLARFEKKPKTQEFGDICDKTDNVIEIYRPEKLKTVVIKKGSSPILAKKYLKPELLGVDYPQEEINFFIDKNKKTVGRAISGKIAIISNQYRETWIKDNETWLCNIILEEERKLIVFPVTKVMSSEDNFNASVEKVAELKSHGFDIPFLKPKNTRLYYSSK